MFRVGLTGGIGSGKSAAAGCFRALGISVVDADWAARVVVQPGQPALAEIARHFGSAILLENGALDRAGLRTRVFDDPAERAWLEQLLHPLIREEIITALTHSPGPYVILESPLLIESGQDQLVHRVCVIDLPEPLQIARASARDNCYGAHIRKVMAAQLSREQRLEKADDVLDNSSGLAALQTQVETLHNQYVKMAAATP
ncbi:dephospho-CoA kinase [uncultured Microbulbifer sp.]|uniref:dephospho-CoA kinase n=1 Tax=uncultured Microbulbifer sp. TaxID=348147 RepID=UPI0026337E68|nr:dephospho-CoA kinase [uncultured Microbulbifer sp.]